MSTKALYTQVQFSIKGNKQGCGLFREHFMFKESVSR